jgi:rhomboid family GlyGly-CTERM serine protease
MIEWQRIRHSGDWRFVGIFVAIAVVLQIIGPEYFRYQSDWPQSGQLWRVVSAHWVHVGWMHLLLNTLGLAICVTLTTPGWSLQRWFVQSLLLAIGISLLCTLQNPEISWYAGFSGVLFGLYFLCAHDLYRRDRLIAVLVASAIVIKVLLEQYTDIDVDSSALIGARVIVDAHLYGLLSAMAIALVWSTYTMNTDTGKHSN